MKISIFVKEGGSFVRKQGFVRSLGFALFFALCVLCAPGERGSVSKSLITDVCVRSCNNSYVGSDGGFISC